MNGYYLMLVLLGGVVLFGLFYYYKNKQRSARVGAALTGGALLLLALSLTRIFPSMGGGGSSLDRFIRYQEVQGAYVGGRVAEEYPGARVGIVQQHDLSGVIKEGAVMNRLTDAIHAVLTDADMDVRVRSLPLPKAMQDMVDRAREEGTMLDENTFLMASENEDRSPIDDFNGMLESLSPEVDVIISVVDFGYGDLLTHLPKKGDAPPIVMVNTWVEQAEEVLEKTAVVAIVRPRRDLDASSHDRSLRGGAKKIFSRRFEYLTLASSPEPVDE
jgi:hypothetical protein